MTVDDYWEVLRAKWKRKPGYFVNPGWENDCQGEKPSLRIQLPNDYNLPKEREVRIERDGIYYEQEKAKMTRQEAIKKIEAVTKAHGGSQMLDCLEALGLIKFESEKSKGKLDQFMREKVVFSTDFDNLYLFDGKHIVEVLKTWGFELKEIKESEKSKEYTAEQVIELGQTQASGKRVIEDLANAGYRIVKLGVNTTVTFETARERRQHWNCRLTDITQS